MIFKTFINDLQNVQSIINRISNVEVWANGATGLLNANSLNSLKTAISGLSKEQALLVLSTKNLSIAQTEQVLSAAGLLNVEKQLTTAQLSEKLAKELNSKADAEALLINSGLITQKEFEENATIKVTAAKINEAVANGTLSASDAGVIAGTLGITGVNAGATISFDLLTASIWANIKALGTWLVTNPIGWAILGGTAIFGLVKTYDALTDSVEEVKERTDALLETYNSTIFEANSNAQTIESLASRYEKLSKGVNALGENVSLTADEYAEYNDIVNQIADMFPTMITGYTDEGNAILSLKGNVEELRDTYKETQKEAYNLLIVSGNDSDGNDIITNYQNQVHGNESFLSKTSSYIDGEAGAKDAIEIITKLTGALTPDEFRETYNQLYKEYENIWNSDKIQDALKSSGFEELTHAPRWSEITAKDLAQVKYSAQATIQTYNAEIDSQLKNMQTLANAYLMTNPDYEKLDEQSKTAVSLLVNSISENIANEFSSKEDVGAYVVKLINSISDNKEVQDSLKKLFTLDTSNMPVVKIKTAVDSYTTAIATAIEEDPIELKARLGLDDSDTQPLINNVKSKLQDKSDDKVGELTLEELHIAAEQVEVPDGALLSWDELITKIKEIQSSSLNFETTVSSLPEEWNNLKTTDNNELRSTREDLLALAEAGRLTEKTFHETAGADTFLGRINESLPETIQWINKLVSSSNQLASMKKGISSISSALGTKKSGRYVDADTLNGFSAEIKGLESWEEFEQLLGSSESSMKDCRKAANRLASEYVNSSNFLSNLNEENQDYYITQLANMGISNAREVVEHELENTIRAQEYATILLADSKYNLIGVDAAEQAAAISNAQTLLSEGEASEFLRMRIFQLVAQEQVFGNQSLDVNGKISALSALASAYLTSAQAARIASYAEHLQGAVEHGMPEAAALESYKSFINSLSTNPIEINMPKVNTPTVGNGISPKGNGKGPDSQLKSKETKTSIDWIDRRLTILQKKLDATKAKFENLFSVKKKAKNLDKQIKETTALLNASEKAAKQYKKRADKIKLSEDRKKDKDLKKKVREGNYSIRDYSQETADKINKYKDYYDKYKDLQKQTEELEKQKRESEEEKYQLYVDNAEAKLDRSKAHAELDEGNYKEQNRHLEKQKQYLEDSR